MNTNHNNTSNSDTSISLTEKEEILKRKQNDLKSHIDKFFDIGGLEMPCDLLKELLSDHCAYSKVHPHAVLDYDFVTGNVFFTMELISFISVLYQKKLEVEEALEAVQ